MDEHDPNKKTNWQQRNKKTLYYIYKNNLQNIEWRTDIDDPSLQLAVNHIFRFIHAFDSIFFLFRKWQINGIEKNFKYSEYFGACHIVPISFRHLFRFLRLPIVIVLLAFCLLLFSPFK